MTRVQGNFRDLHALVTAGTGPLALLDASERNAHLQQAIPQLFHAPGYAAKTERLFAAIDDNMLFGNAVPPPPSQLRNTYYLGRHGESDANLQGVISSGPKAFTDHGLSATGVAQALASSTAHAVALAGALIIASPLSRASTTAALHAGVVGAGDFSHDLRLRERHFGKLDGKSTKLYPTVWAEDAVGASSYGVESPRHVRDRVCSLIADLEKRYSGQTVVLVSHGDTAQITETWFRGIEANRHRELTSMVTGELRRMSV